MRESPSKLKSSEEEEEEEEELPLPAMKGDMDQSPEQRAAIVQVKVDLSIDKVQCMKAANMWSVEVTVTYASTALKLL